MRLWQAAAAAALALAACAGPAPREDFYTLAAVAPPGAGPGASATSIYVGPVTVPEAVDRLPMVLRVSPNQVEIRDFHRWAEPLEAAIPRVLAENLSRLLGTPHVLSARQGTGRDVDYRVAVEVQRFESSLQEGATLDALWTVTPAKGRGAARSGRTVAQEPAATADPAGLAAAHSRALARLAGDIAGALR